VTKDKFTGGDQNYLRETQYRDPSRLTARADLHAKYGTAEVRWFPWMAGQIEWPTDGEILEVGCGPGWLWTETASQLPNRLRLVLTDLSAGMVQAALDRVSRVFATTTGCEADAQRLPFRDGAFHLILANHMLYHVPWPGLAVGEFARTLQPGGALVAATVGPDHLRQLWEIRSEVFDVEPVNRTAEVFGSLTGLPMIQQHFSHVEWRPCQDHLHCTDPDDVMAFMTSTPPAEDASEGQLRDLHAAVARRFDRGGGSFDISKELGIFLATDPHP
jgi:ubiquinone/menaquinone biosynthesis C-methylase UbiE